MLKFSTLIIIDNWSIILHQVGYKQMILFDQHYENLEGFFYLFQSAAFTFSFTTIKSYDLFITII